MTAIDMLTELRHKGLGLRVVNGQIHYRAPRGVLAPELRAAPSAHKAQLLAMLSPPRDPHPLDPVDCLALIREAFDAVEADYVPGTLALLDADPDLARRFLDTESATDATVTARPTESELRAVLAAHVAVMRECCARMRARRERATYPPALPRGV